MVPCFSGIGCFGDGNLILVVNPVKVITSGIGNTVTVGGVCECIAISKVAIDLRPDGTSVRAPVELSIASAISFECEDEVWVLRVYNYVCDISTVAEVSGLEPVIAAIAGEHHAYAVVFDDKSLRL